MIRGRRRERRLELPTTAQAAPAGRFVAGVLSHLRESVRPGDSLLDVDAEAHRMIREAGATSCYLDYHPRFGAYPFGRVMCTSVNDTVLHGRPYERVLEAGDLLSLDFAIELEGWVADSALSFVVGADATDPADLALIDDVETVMWAGIAEVRAGAHVGDIGHAVEAEARRLGHVINHEFGGHGVGRTMHESPFVPNHGEPGAGPELRAGMLLTVEPFLMHGTDQVHITDRDGWSVMSVDGSRGAHAEHTLQVTDGPPIVLTAREGEELRVGVRAGA
ncbi:type I methionyl aminopeptidase [Brachybacterium endophyticum]|uniref:Methionine aminopeptidase n=1 Tax=Brachybacterium endophyticum TaxID=2182385 RepID=A0A2U2RIY6_9MICO|nr:type I methionyl aminopeptidase [Brachybacterium endophyticum]PWH05823.1 type I methionyl aminopeptidase [Brachybacterium endophyticum]